MIGIANTSYQLEAKLLINQEIKSDISISRASNMDLMKKFG
jgi:hypothetical protein